MKITYEHVSESAVPSAVLMDLAEHGSVDRLMDAYLNRKTQGAGSGLTASRAMFQNVMVTWQGDTRALMRDGVLVREDLFEMLKEIPEKNKKLPSDELEIIIDAKKSVLHIKIG